MNSQLLYVLILVGIVALLLLACIYLAGSQKTPNSPSASQFNPLRAKGLGPVLDSTEHLNKELSAAKQHRRQSKYK